MSTTTTQAVSRDDVIEVIAAGGLGRGGFEASAERMLDFITELGSVRRDQLGRFPTLDAEAVDDVLSGLCEAGFVHVEPIVRGEPAWVWTSSLGRRGRGGSRRPDLRHLDHRYYVNEVRLYLASVAPRGRWLGEREFRFAPVSPRFEYPDAIWELDGVSHAVEVEISGKSSRRLHELIVAKSVTYERVVYFCTDGGDGCGSVLRKVAAAVDAAGVQNVAVREVPGVSPRPPLKIARGRRGPLRPGEREVAVWVSEQGGARLDHLARLLSVSVREAEAVVAACEEAGSIGRVPGLEGELDWFWLRGRGARIAANGLRVHRIHFSRYRYLAVVNDLRLRFEASGAEGVWASRRMAERGGRGAGRSGRSPDGVIEFADGTRTAVYVALNVQMKGAAPMLLRRFSSEFDRVVLVGPKRARTGAAGAAARWGLGNVEFADLEGRLLETRPRRAVKVSLGHLPASGSVPAEVTRLVTLCGEEGFLTTAELVRLTGFGSDDVERWVQVGVGLDLLRDDWGDALGRQVFGPTSKGVRFAGLSVVAARRPVVDIGEHHVLVQARIELAAGQRGVRWLSRRVLAGAVGRGPRLLKGLLEREGRTYGIEVQLGRVLQTRRVRDRLGWIRERCDGLIVYCTSAGRPGIDAMVAREGWTGVEVRAVSAVIEADREEAGRRRASVRGEADSSLGGGHAGLPFWHAGRAMDRPCMPTKSRA